ncbi:MAG: hypothetical protein WCH46_04515 [bacterium]
MMNKRSDIFSLIALLAIVLCVSPAFSQSRDSVPRRRVLREDLGPVKKLTIMPYATLSYNLQSGQAFPKNAQGVGYGFGLAFDLTEDRQPLGAYFDFAYQDMRAHALDGSCGRIPGSGDISQSLPVTHYFSYAQFEAFLKLQSHKTNGYFLIGASAGLATTGLTEREGAIAEDRFSEWKTVETYNQFRLDLRAGIGVKLGYISAKEVVIEARFGYPLTNVLGEYHDFCNGSGAFGPWRIVTMQMNVGLRL